MTTTGLKDKAGTAVAVGNIASGSFDTLTGADAGSTALAAGDVIVEMASASLSSDLDFAASTEAAIVTAVEAKLAGNNFATGGTPAAYVETTNSEELLMIFYEAASKGSTTDAVIVELQETVLLTPLMVKSHFMQFCLVSQQMPWMLVTSWHNTNSTVKTVLLILKISPHLKWGLFIQKFFLLDPAKQQATTYRASN